MISPTPPHAMAAYFAAGLMTADPELTWDEAAGIIVSTLGMRERDVSDLQERVDDWLLERGTNRSRLAGDYRRARG